MFLQFLQDYNISENIIATGVSGGSDSLALTLMAAEELHALGYKIVALTVDHRLRPTSAKEAAYVKEILSAHGIEHHILVWHGTKPQTGIEEAARAARYKLIQKWCDENNVHSIMMAHHLNDQAETFFLRLARGSGLDGLCGMSPISTRENLKILRPLLYTPPEVLKEYLRQKHISWIEDESNRDESLLRVKIRNFLPILAQNLGISPLQICQTMKRLQNSRRYIAHNAADFEKESIQIWENGALSIDYSSWRHLDNEIKLRILNKQIQKMGSLEYPPRSESVLCLIGKIENDEFKSATLGGCEFILYHNILWLVPEIKTCPEYCKEEWEKYLIEHPQLRRKKIPYKMRRSLVQNKAPV